MRLSWLSCLAFGLVAAVLVGCGGSDDEAATATPTGAPRLGAAEIGQQAGDFYVRALSEVTELLKSKPDVSQVRTRVQELKESYVRKLVELGRAREALDAAGKSTVDAAIRTKVDSLARETWYPTYNEVQQYYFSKDQEFQRLVLSFNVIGQYANFELLKKQEPQEAKRLGLD